MNKLPKFTISGAIPLFLSLVLASNANCQESIDSTARWKAPITRENGDPITLDEIAAYKLYRKNGEQLSVLATVPGGTSHTFTIPAGECFQLYVTAVDTSNLESKPSNEVEVCAMAPNAPTDFKVTVP